MSNAEWHADQSLAARSVYAEDNAAEERRKITTWILRIADGFDLMGKRAIAKALRGVTRQIERGEHMR